MLAKSVVGLSALNLAGSWLVPEFTAGERVVGMLRDFDLFIITEDCLLACRENTAMAKLDMAKHVNMA